MLSQKRKAYSGSTGRVAEVRFVRAAEEKGLQVTKSSRSEDINGHVDYWLAYDNVGHWGVDVKGNNLPDEIWVELQNVQGKPGWLSGDAKIIAFDMPEEGGFSVVDRLELKEWVDNNISSEVVSDKRQSIGKMYQRRDRQDLITKLNLQDLRSLQSYRVWVYFDDY
jgi:hypothetical protein